MTAFILSISPMLGLDDFLDNTNTMNNGDVNDDQYQNGSENNISQHENHSCCCCCCIKQVHFESWWHYHDTFTIYKTAVLLHSTPNIQRKIICCNYYSHIFQFTYKCYSMKTYIECCCFTCLAM